MATSNTLHVRDIVTAALKKAQITSWDEAPNSVDADLAIDGLNRLLKSWQNRGYNVWTKTSASLTLTTAASYTLTPPRPLRILSARLKRDGIETPMVAMTREQYDALPQKLSTGLPTQFYYNRQREDALFYVWPVLGTVAGETVEITYERELEDATDMSEEVDLPAEWYEAAVYGLADRLMDNSGRVSDKITARAEEELRVALAFDREDTVTFAGGLW